MELAFDLEALLGVALLACVIVAIAGALRARGQAAWPVSADLASAALTALGVFWFVSRLYVS